MSTIEIQGSPYTHSEMLGRPSGAAVSFPGRNFQAPNFAQQLTEAVVGNIVGAVRQPLWHQPLV